MSIKYDYLIVPGFIVEVLLFYSAGFFAGIKKIISIPLFIMAVGVAFIVGDWIEKRAIQKYRIR